VVEAVSRMLSPALAATYMGPVCALSARLNNKRKMADENFFILLICVDDI
jgi:hypothetical protein